MTVPRAPQAAGREPVDVPAPSSPSSADGDRDAGERVRVQRTVVFADGDGGGNPCPVVLGADGWSADRMQRTAAAMGQETAFVLAPRAGGDARLRYFVPRHEMEMCVHATVASVVVLGRAGALPSGRAQVETPLGVLRVWWDVEGRDGWTGAARGWTGAATVEQLRPRFGDPVADPREVLEALGARPDDLDPAVGPVTAVSTARPKLMVPLCSEEALDALQPDVERLWALCEQLDVTGLYPFTLQARGADVAARQFPLRVGYDEDPATGVAAGALAAYLAGRPAGRPAGRRAGAGAGAGAEAGAAGRWTWTVAQGRAMGRPSLITAEADVSGSGDVVGVRVGGGVHVVGEPEPWDADA